MIISNSSGFIFVHIHKTGGTSITSALGQTVTWEDIVCGGTEYGYKLMEVWGRKWGVGKHARAEEIYRLVGSDVWRDYFTFSFVRHPIDRIKSLYSWTKDTVHQRGWRRHIGTYLPDPVRGALPGYRDDVWEWPTVKAYLKSDSFSQYIRHPEFRKSPAAQPQYSFLADPTGEEIMVDFVGRLEKMNSDFRKVCEGIGIDRVTIGRSNRSKGTECHVRAKDRTLLRKYYQKDFEAFGYEI